MNLLSFRSIRIEAPYLATQQSNRDKTPGADLGAVEPPLHL